MSSKPVENENKGELIDSLPLSAFGADKLLKPVASAMKSIEAMKTGDAHHALMEGLSAAGGLNKNIAKAATAAKVAQKLVAYAESKAGKPVSAPQTNAVIADHPLSGRAINDFAAKVPSFMPRPAPAGDSGDEIEPGMARASVGLLPGFSDQTRLLRFYAALPADKTLQIESFHGSAGLSELFSFHLTLIATNADIDLKDMIGKNVTIGIQHDQTDAHYINGYVNSFAFSHSDGGFAFYHAEIVPWLAYLTRRVNCRIFQDESVVSVLTTIFSEDYSGFADYEFRLTKSCPTENYIVQYNESDENFVCRLLEKHGLFYYFEHHATGHKMVIADTSSSEACCKPHPLHAKIEFNAGNRTQDKDAITHIGAQRTLQSAKVALNTFDFKAPLTPQYVELPTVAEQGDVPKLEIFDGNPAFNYKNVTDGAREAKQRLEVFEWQAKVFAGTSDCRGLQPGKTFILTNHEWFKPENPTDADFVVLSVSYSARNNYFERGGSAVYGNSFTCIRRKIPYRPRLTHAKPRMPGPQTATVVGPKGAEIHTDKFGRIKVQFHWDRYGRHNETSSCWIRVSQPWAGQNWGTVAIPRIAQEVIIDYLEGDPDRPVCTGRLYNVSQPMPYALPDAAHMMGFKSRSTPGGGGYCEMVIHDKKGHELINIHSQKDMVTTVQNMQATIVNGASQTNRITSGFQITTVKKKIEMESQTEFIHLKAATAITLEVGASKILLDASGKITIQGVHVDVIGSGRIDLNTNAGAAAPAPSPAQIPAPAPSVPVMPAGAASTAKAPPAAGGRQDPALAAPKVTGPKAVQTPATAPKPSTPARSGNGKRIGHLSRKHETSGRGVGTVSTGVGDPGGVSYGSYQLASKKGMVQSFLRAEGAEWAHEFKGLDPTVRDGDFGKKWKEIAAKSPKQFEDAQHNFIERTHYKPVLASVKKQTGVNLLNQSETLKDVVWSCSVQHQGAAGFIAEAVQSVKLKPDSLDYDKALINAIYDHRSSYVGKSKKLKPDIKANLQARYAKERKDALVVLQQEQD
ncbi:type VI secretion system Vgr family protein [Noviherbaspirillum saxi]|uniref:Type VI secretion system tip protein VgrG n=1 Tax=Noviherbaspirillum saxi TaxID=2320863 RepID=A0A3A3FZ42_9BURK|nr:type VI secretion system tip protein TssI/VgrG [Noviherbaspirillum saxi]RJF99471.1 type VI secretion system tip protein VgrG [Noviherbaspirillum saxi]